MNSGGSCWRYADLGRVWDMDRKALQRQTHTSYWHADFHMKLKQLYVEPQALLILLHAWPNLLNL